MKIVLNDHFSRIRNMKPIATHLFALLALATVQAHASTTQVDATYFATKSQMIDFETGEYQQPPNVPGVQFAQEVFPSTFYGSRSGGLFGTYGYANIVSDPYGNPKFTDLAINFTTPVSAVGAWVGDIWNFLGSNESLVTVSLFDTNHNLLAQNDVNLSGIGTPVFLGFSSSENIGRIEWNGENGGFFAVDNLMFDQISAVPNPSAWMLFAAGLVVIRLMPKRARHRQA
jgi:hypothetical protein